MYRSGKFILYTLQEVKNHISLLFTYKRVGSWVNATPVSFLYTNYLVTNQGAQVMGDIQLLRWAQTQFHQPQGEADYL